MDCIFGTGIRPSPTAQICIRHFSPHEISYTGGQKRLMPGALPKLYRARPVVVETDHTYSNLHRDTRADFLTLLMTLTPILFICLPFLLVMLYSWSDHFSGNYSIIFDTGALSYIFIIRKFLEIIHK